MPMPQDMSDAELMQRYCAGDVHAFDALYARHRRAVFGFLLKQSRRDVAEVEEIFQEAWIKLVRQRDSYDPARPFLPWLYTIARNAMVDRWRHLGRMESIHVANDDLLRGASSDGLARPERRAGSEGLRQRWDDALALLPPEQREALLLRYEAGMGLEEIATVTGCGRETVKSRLRYAVNKLREQLADIEEEVRNETA